MILIFILLNFDFAHLFSYELFFFWIFKHMIMLYFLECLWLQDLILENLNG